MLDFKVPTSTARHSARRLLLPAISHCYRASRGRSNRLRSVLRVLRALRCRLSPDLYRQLAAAGFYLDLEGRSTVRDPFPFYTSELYLIRRLRGEERMRAFLTHRNLEQARRTPAYFDDVYRDGGVVLCGLDVDGAAVRLQLEQSEERDRNEGELSVVLRVDGQACYRVSFSYVPQLEPASREPDHASGEISFLIARSQTLTGSGHDHFVKVLPNESAQMYALAATSGIAVADGFSRVRGIHEAEQVGYKGVLSNGFRRSYSGTWDELPGADKFTDHTAFAAIFPATADAPVTAKNRSRARRRRRTWDMIRESACQTLDGYVRTDQL